MSAADQLDIDTLARTLYGEARGESIDGMTAVAHVVLNRVAKPGWWTRNKDDGIPDDTIAAACRHPWQFSAWNENDPNRQKIEAVTLDDRTFQRCYAVALAVITGLPGFADPTDGATHYHTTGVAPDWAEGHQFLSIGNHRFYTDIES